MAFDNTTAHVASEYDALINKTIPYYSCFHEETVHLVKAVGNSPEIWLDTGCGTGNLTEKLLAEFPGTTFLLSDPSAEMLEQAKKKFAGKDLERVRFLEPAGTGEITLPDTLKPDVITAIQAHHYLNPGDRAAATHRCFELLKEGGVYITFENTRPLTEKGTETGRQNWMNYQISSGKDKEAARKHMDRFDVEYFPITVEQHLKLLRDTGFKVVEILWYSYMQSGYYCIK